MTSEETDVVRSPEASDEDLTSTDTRVAMSSKTSKKGASQSRKRSASTPEPEGTSKVTKRRAARACVSCRARKVRCDVVEGAPCGNCRWDNVECVVQESRRRRKSHFTTKSTAPLSTEVQLKAKKATKTVNIASAAAARPTKRRPSEVSQPSTVGNDTSDAAALPQGASEGHVAHLLYQQSGLKPNPALLSTLQASNDGSRFASIWPNLPCLSKHVDPNASIGAQRTVQFLNSLEDPDVTSQLPAFIRPLPAKIGAEDVRYLHAKGALVLPHLALQNALLRAYVEYVHPYMPLIELYEFLSVVDSRDGLRGQTSLLLYQSIMFAATAFVDVKCLRDAGYPTRKAARRAFFYKARLLYDFDYESDRLVLVQALLLMTYWYETPDDQKDTWHWMGVAISLAHTIGLHRNPANTTIAPRKQKLWKRIWWSCFMRDRLVALGMRRPTRIKDEDFDVPMLEEQDFEIEALPDEIQVIGPECTLVRDASMQRELALMCISKARLCLCISHMLKTQYSVLIRDKSAPENTTNSTMMLFPNKQLDNVETVAHCDVQLMSWAKSLPACCQYRPLSALDVQHGRAPVAVQRNLLHMVYQTTVSALHRPQFLPSSPMHAPQASVQVQEMSRMRVRESAAQITRMVAELSALRLEKYLPTTGVTVVLPAMIIHLLEMKSPFRHARDEAVRSFRTCMKVMDKLRDMYSAADYAVAFLEAALRKAAIDVHGMHSRHQQQQHQLFGNNNGGIGGLSAHDIKAAIMSSFPNAVAGGGIDDLTTPPPEDHPYAQTNNLVREPDGTPQEMAAGFFMPSSSSSALASHPFFPPAVAAAVKMDSFASATTMHSPLQDILTPSASASGSSSSDGGPPNASSLDLDMDFEAMDHEDEFNWNALTGTNIDFDQWLHLDGTTTTEDGPTAGGGSGSGSGLVTMSQIDGSANYERELLGLSST